MQSSHFRVHACGVSGFRDLGTWLEDFGVYNEQFVLKSNQDMSKKGTVIIKEIPVDQQYLF